MNRKFRLFETFAGIGTQKMALNNVLGKDNIEVVGMCEWYIDAILAYGDIHCTDQNYDQYSCSLAEKKLS